MRSGVVRGGPGWLARLTGRLRGLSRRQALALGALVLLPVAAWALRAWLTAWPARVVLRLPTYSQALAFSPDGRIVATGDSDGRLSFWDTADGRKRSGYVVPNLEGLGPGFVGTFSADGRTFAALTSSTPKSKQPSRLILVDVATGRAREPIDTRNTWPDACVLLPGGRTVRLLLWAPGCDFEVADHDLATGALVATRSLEIPRELRPVFSADAQRLAIRAGSPSKSNVATPDVAVYDVATGKETVRLSGRKGGTSAFATAFSPDGQTLAVGREDGSVELWDLATKQVRITFQPHSKRSLVRFLRFSPDGRTLASVAFDLPESISGRLVMYASLSLRGRPFEPTPELVLLDARTGRALRRQNEEFDPLFSPDGRTLATSDGWTKVFLRDAPGPR